MVKPMVWLSIMGIVSLAIAGCMSRSASRPTIGASPDEGNSPADTVSPGAKHTVFNEVDTEPLLLESAEPSYPAAARKAHVRGTVYIMATINETGKVIEAWVSKSVDPALDDAALAAAYKYRFTPARLNGIAVKATVTLPFRFM
ncbi:MAG: TonB family protein [Candidatus Eisenbacteria bacterium]